MSHFRTNDRSVKTDQQSNEIENSKMERTRQSLKEALEANIQAQQAVENQLKAIRVKKKKNREEAAEVFSHVPRKSLLDNYATSFGNRPWAKIFFMDQNGDTPPLNEDTRLRRSQEGVGEIINKSPLWKKKDLEALYETIDSLKEENRDKNDPKEDSMMIDFKKVAFDLNTRPGNLTKRTAEECRVKYQPNRSPVTKEEYLSMLRQFHNGEELSLSNGRTKWQAFSAFRSFHSRQGNAATPWTLDEDKLLLQTIAAAGPQQVVDQLFVSKISPALKKSPKVILQRTMNSLLNPKYINDAWSDDDERKLCLLMKIYCNCPSPLSFVSSYFPSRGSRSVHDKWSRTLDPIYDFDKFFTREEDEKLMQLTGDTDWKSVEKDFPGRKSQSIFNRWRVLASEEQVLDYCRTSLKRKFTRDADCEDIIIRRIKHSTEN